MGAFADFLDQGEVTAAPESPGQFAQGMRSGFLGAGSQLNALAGGVAEAVGADEFAQERFRSMRELQGEAQAAAPRITSYKDVGGIRDAFDYATGLMGQSLPVTGAALGGALLTKGRGAAPMLAAGAATAPFEIGDVVQRQQNDPASMEADAGTRMRDAALFGAGSAALQSVVPGIVAGKVLGTTAKTAAKSTTGDILMRGAGNTLLEGATEGGGEVVKQAGLMATSPDQAFDTDAIMENVVGGAAAGAPLAGVGVAGELAHKAAAAPGRALDAAKDKIEGLDIGDKAAGALGATKEAGADTAGAVRDAFENTAGKAKEYVQRVAAGEDIADLNPLKGMDPAKIAENLTGWDAERAQKVTTWFNELAADAGLTPDKREQLMAAGADLTDKANQKIVAGIKFAKEGAADLAAKAKGLRDSFETKKAAGTEVKKSEDYSGADQAIAKALVPVLQRSNPDIFEPGNEGALKDMAGGVREMIALVQAGGKDSLSSDQVFALIDTFGEDTIDALDAVYQAVGGTDPTQLDAFYGAVNRVRDAQAGRDGLRGVLRKNLIDPELASDEQLDAVTRGLRQHVLGRSDPNATPASAEKAMFDDARLQFELDKFFGKKSGAVLDAIEKDVKREQKASALEKEKLATDDEGNEIDQRDPATKLTERDAGEMMESIPYGRYSIDETTGKDSYDGLTLRPDLEKDPAKNQVTAALERARKEHPTKNVEFLSAKQLGENHPGVKRKAAELLDEIMEANPDMAAKDIRAALDTELAKYGMVVAKRDLGRIMIKRQDGATPSSHYKNPARLDANGQVFDAIKMTALMQERFADDYTEADNKSTPHRVARMFMEAVAAVQEATGKSFEVPDATRITKGGLTWGEVKGLDFTPPGKDGATLASEVNRLRAEYKTADAKTKKDILEEVRQLTYQRDRELAGFMEASAREKSAARQDKSRANGYEADPYEERDYRYGDDGMLTAEGARWLMEGDAHGGIETDKAGAITRSFLKDRGEARAKAERDANTGDGRREVDPFGPTHDVLRGGDDKGAVIRTESSGNPRGSETIPAKRLRNSQIAELTQKFKSFAENGKSAGAKSIGQRGLALMAITNNMSDHDHKRLVKLLGGAKASDVGAEVAALAEKYSKQLGGAKKAEPAKPAPAKAEPEPKAPKLDTKVIDRIAAKTIDGMVAKDDYGTLKNNADSEAFLIAAAKRLVELHKSHETDEEFSAYYNLSDMFKEGGFQTDLGSFFEAEQEGQKFDDDSVRAMIYKAVPEVAALARPKGQTENYAATAKSLQGVKRTTGTHTQSDRAATRAYVDSVLGPSVKVAFKNLLHAGEFETNGVDSIIRVSVHSLNPLSVAHHEALHAFFSKLMGQGNYDVARVLKRAATTAPVLNQLKALLANEPAALAQLADPEEAAAYMYQFWAAGQLTLGSQTQGWFQKISAAFRQALGIWSNDERALEILDYFHRGDFKANAANPGAVSRALVEAGRNAALEKAKSFTQPLRDLSDAAMTVGGERLRDTGIPALRELADAMKLHGEAQGKDVDFGFLPAARAEAARVRNKMAEDLAGYSKEQINEALEAMQHGTQAASPEGRLIQRVVQGPGGLLPRMLDYMRAAGVNVAGLKIDHQYFPRVWDTSFISRHQGEFLAMLEKYKLSGQMTGEPMAVLQKLMAADGNEFTVEVDKPGMQALKERVLAFVADADAAPFMRKDLYEILNSYITQATRRGEWARRFGDQGEKLGALVTQAKAQGASDQDIDAAHKYVRAVDGTLGDRIDPRMRHLMGNMIVYQNIRLLPLAIFSSVVDPLGIVVRGGTVGEAFTTFKRGIAEVKKNFQAEPQADGATRMAQLMGVIDDAMLVHSLGAVYSQGMVGDTGRKINDVFFRFNLMEQFNRSMRVGASQAALAFLARHADGTASPHSARWMKELGYDVGEYDAAVLDDKAKAAVNRWVDGAVLRPDAADKPIWMSDPRWMLLSHLKQFVYSFQQTILKRVAHEYRHGNYAPAMALTSYVPAMIAADAIKGMIQGGGETPEWKKNWGVTEYVGHGVERAGLLGVGQFAVDSMEMGPMGALAGPTIGQLWDATKVAGGAKEPGGFVLKAMPANALYSGFAKNAETPDVGLKGT
jgi:hypothetical protein